MDLENSFFSYRRRASWPQFEPPLGREATECLEAVDFDSPDLDRALGKMRVVAVASAEILAFVRAVWEPEPRDAVPESESDDLIPDGAPVRGVLTRSAVRTTGWFNSLKNGAMTACESLGEMYAAAIFECDPRVRGYVPQPLTLRYPEDKGRVRHHVPDWLVWRHDGPYVVEIKPAAKAMQPDWRWRFQLCRLFLQGHGIRYRVWDEHVVTQEPRISNCRALLRFRDQPVQTDERQRVLEHLARTSVATIAELAAAADAPDGGAVVHALMLRGFFDFDLNQPIGPETALRRAP